MGGLRLSTAGEVTIALDFRTDASTGRFIPTEEFATLLGAISAITGPGTKLFFDFGKVSIIGANLEDILERFAEASS